jgi:hypothetical protein
MKTETKKIEQRRLHSEPIHMKRGLWWLVRLTKRWCFRRWNVVWSVRIRGAEFEIEGNCQLNSRSNTNEKRCCLLIPHMCLHGVCNDVAEQPVALLELLLLLLLASKQTVLDSEGGDEKDERNGAGHYDP